MNNKEIVKSWFTAIDAKDFKAVKNLLDAKHQFRNPNTLYPIGADEHIENIKSMTSALEGKHTIELIFSEGENVAVSGKWKGKQTGKFEGVPATGNPVEFYFVDLFKIVDSKIQSEHFEMNPSNILSQISDISAHA